MTGTRPGWHGGSCTCCAGHAPVQPGRQWPAFTAEAGKLGARVVFAFPLAIGVRHQARRFDLFIDAIRKAGNFYLALARLPH